MFKGLAIICGQSDMQEYPGKGVTLRKTWVIFTSQAILVLSDSSQVHSVVVVTVMCVYFSGNPVLPKVSIWYLFSLL